MTKIDTIEDLVRIIEEHPGWLDRIRNLILTEELMRLPGRFDRFAEDFDQFANKTEGRLVSLEDGQERLERGQTQLEGGQERLERGQTQLEGGQERLERGQTQLERAGTAGKKADAVGKRAGTAGKRAGAARR